jgi:hypothetical protein
VPLAQAKKFEILVDPQGFDAPDFGADAKKSPGKAANQACVEKAFNKDYKNTNAKAEQSYNMKAKPPEPVPGRPRGTKTPGFCPTHQSCRTGARSQYRCHRDEISTGCYRR